MSSRFVTIWVRMRWWPMSAAVWIIQIGPVSADRCRIWPSLASIDQILAELGQFGRVLTDSGQLLANKVGRKFAATSTLEARIRAKTGDARRTFLEVLKGGSALKIGLRGRNRASGTNIRPHPSLQSTVLANSCRSPTKGRHARCESVAAWSGLGEDWSKLQFDARHP